MKVGFVSADWSPFTDSNGHPLAGGSGYYRAVLPYRYLSANGFEVAIGGSIAVTDGEIKVIDFDNEQHGGCDVIVFQRWMNREAPRVIEGGKAVGQVIINDVDDWYEGISTSNRAWLDSHPKANVLTNREHYNRVLRASSGLTVSTPYLAERYAKLNDRVRVVRNGIDLDRWETKDKEWTDRPTIGWVGATNWRSNDLETLRGVLGPFMENNKLFFIHGGHQEGASKARDLLGLDTSVPSSEIYMQPIDRYPQLFDPIDIGLVPLSRVPFNQAKSAIKGMEYAAAGVPFVAANMPEYRWLQEAHGIGLTAKNPTQWKRHLTALLDPVARNELAKRNRSALTSLDMSSQWVNWFKAYASILTEAF